MTPRDTCRGGFRHGVFLEIGRRFVPSGQSVGFRPKCWVEIGVCSVVVGPSCLPVVDGSVVFLGLIVSNHGVVFRFDGCYCCEMFPAGVCLEI